jgi:integrase
MRVAGEKSLTEIVMDYPTQPNLGAPVRSVVRVVALQTIDIPSIPFAAARERFLSELRWKTSRITRRHTAPGTISKYWYWLRRLERWLIDTDRSLDLGMLGDDAVHALQASVVEEIDAGTLQESSANTYLRCVKTFFNHVWMELGLEPSSNPARKLQAGGQGVGEFPLFTREHVRALMNATMRPRGVLVPPWIPFPDRVVLATFLDLGWRVGEASKAVLDDVDLRGRFVTIRKENVKVFRGRVVGLNMETGRLLQTWMTRWRPAVPHMYLFVNDDGSQFSPDAIRKMFRRLAVAAGIPAEVARCSPHSCRHYFPVQWATSHPGDLAGLQRVLGHSSYRSTKGYIERAEDIGAAERHQEMAPNWR